jgi:hypothetical protein
MPRSGMVKNNNINIQNIRGGNSNSSTNENSLPPRKKEQAPAPMAGITNDNEY